MKQLIVAILFTLTAGFILPAVTGADKASAQIVTTLTPIAANDTLTNADTALFYICTNATAAATFSSTNSIADNISRSIGIRLTRLSGTAAGSATFAGSIDATNWTTINTDTFTNGAENSLVYNMRASSGDLLYKYYRVTVITSGTVSAIPRVYYLRRSN